jgi:hypothetical protein
MRFSVAERVRWVEHIAYMWEGLEISVIFQSKYLNGRPILVDRGIDGNRAELHSILKVKGVRVYTGFH